MLMLTICSGSVKESDKGMDGQGHAEGQRVPSVFIVEDDEALCDGLMRLLCLQGFAAERCMTFSKAAAEALAANADCVVLDLKLPDADGLQICRDIRAVSKVPIIMLTSSESEFDEVMAFGLGADDYVTKPYRPATLLARIQSVLRRHERDVSTVMEYAGVMLDVAAGTVSYAGTTRELSRNEQRILQLLMRNAGSVVSRQHIMADLWESDEFVDDNTLTVNVNRLRKVLGAIGAPEDLIKTRRGMGYSI